MAESVKRLQKEYRALCKEPVSHVVARPSPNDILEWREYIFFLLFSKLHPLDIYFQEPVSHVVARPSPNDILEWHYVLEGSEDTPFAGGYYYGKIKFPPEYPFKPPGITMTTPNGRFITQKKICLSMSDFHPESWNPMWSVSSILTGLLSFMMDNSPTTGSISSTVAERQQLAKVSLAFNCKNPTFRKIFPEYVEKYNEQKLLEQSVSQQSLPKSPSIKEPPPEQKTSTQNLKEQGNRGETPYDMRKNKRTKNISTWMLILMVSVFGIVMALPLIHL